jgi:hypothetical protein
MEHTTRILILTLLTEYVVKHPETTIGRVLEGFQKFTKIPFEDMTDEFMLSGIEVYFSEDIKTIH